MKYFLLLMLALPGWFATPVSAEGKGAMVVETKGGDKVLFYFAQKPEMAFSGADVEIKSTAETVLYPMSDVAQIKFDEEATSGITNLKSGNVSFRFTDGQLTVEGLAPASLVAVYSTGGVLCLQGKADGSGRVVLSTGALTRGAYIVKTDKVTYKIVKK